MLLYIHTYRVVRCSMMTINNKSTVQSFVITILPHPLLSTIQIHYTIGIWYTNIKYKILL